MQILDQNGIRFWCHVPRQKFHFNTPTPVLEGHFDFKKSSIDLIWLNAKFAGNHITDEADGYLPRGNYTVLDYWAERVR